MSFEAATPDDAPEVIALWEECGLTRPWNDPLSDFTRMCGKDNSDVLVARRDGRIHATISVGDENHRAWVYYLAVAPDAQGQGWGRKAMQAAEDWIKARGGPKLMLMVRRSNASVHAFYAALGYQESDVTVFEKWL